MRIIFIVFRCLTQRNELQLEVWNDLTDKRSCECEKLLTATRSRDELSIEKVRENQFSFGFEKKHPIKLKSERDRKSGNGQSAYHHTTQHTTYSEETMTWVGGFSWKFRTRLSFTCGVLTHRHIIALRHLKSNRNRYLPNGFSTSSHHRGITFVPSSVL